MSNNSNIYFNKNVITENGIGVGDQMFFADGDIRVLVRHWIKDLKHNPPVGGVLLTIINDKTLSCLIHYSKDDVKFDLVPVG